MNSNAIARHVKERKKKHEIDWDNMVVLEKEKRLIPRKILESAHIKKNKQKCMNLNEGIGVSAVYGKGKRAWLRRRRQDA